jgi:hypothetical protein
MSEAGRNRILLIDLSVEHSGQCVVPFLQALKALPASLRLHLCELHLALHLADGFLARRHRTLKLFFALKYYPGAYLFFCHNLSLHIHERVHFFSALKHHPLHPHVMELFPFVVKVFPFAEIHVSDLPL